MAFLGGIRTDLVQPKSILLLTMSHTINGDFVKSSREYVDFAKCRQNVFFRILQSLSDFEKNDIKIRMSGGN